MNEQQIRQIIKDEIAKAASDAQYNYSLIPYHEHLGTDAPQLNPAFFLGFPIMASAPTDKPLNGTIRLSDIAGVRKIHAFISGVWYSVVIA